MFCTCCLIRDSNFCYISNTNETKTCILSRCCIGYVCNKCISVYRQKPITCAFCNASLELISFRKKKFEDIVKHSKLKSWDHYCEIVKNILSSSVVEYGFLKQFLSHFPQVHPLRPRWDDLNSPEIRIFYMRFIRCYLGYSPTIFFYQSVIRKDLHTRIKNWENSVPNEAMMRFQFAFVENLIVRLLGKFRQNRFLKEKMRSFVFANIWKVFKKQSKLSEGNDIFTLPEEDSVLKSLILNTSSIFDKICDFFSDLTKK